MPRNKKAEHSAEPQTLSRSDAFFMDLFFWLQALIAVLISLIMIFTFLGRAIGVRGNSMLSTLHNGNLVLLQTIGYTPAQGDVVVVTKTSFSEDPIIKRVIAVGGQTVTIDLDKKEVSVDGQVLDEPYIREEMYGTGVRDIFVPDGFYFVMGDNRNHSTDSRSIGLIDRREILGHAHAVLFPFDNFGWIA